MTCSLQKRGGSFAVLVVVAGCGLSLGSSGDAAPRNPIAGTWKGVDQLGQTMEFTFQDDGRMTLQVTGKRGSFTKTGTYRVDDSFQPAHLDVKLTDRPEIQTILEVIDEDRIAFENINSSDARPKRFGDLRIVLTRQ